MTKFFNFKKYNAIERPDYSATAKAFYVVLMSGVCFTYYLSNLLLCGQDDRFDISDNAGMWKCKYVIWPVDPENGYLFLTDTWAVSTAYYLLLYGVAMVISISACFC